MVDEIALLEAKPDVAKVEGYFERASRIARQQQAKSWGLRAAMSTARFWHVRGNEARNILAPVYV